MKLFGKKNKKVDEKTTSSSEQQQSSSTVLSQPEQSTTTVNKQKVNVLIIDSYANGTHWKQLFDDWNAVNDHPLHYTIDVATWPDIVSVKSYNEYSTTTNKPKITCECTLKDSQKMTTRSFRPSYVIVRKLVCGMRLTENYTNTLLAFMYARVPSMNTFHSVYMNLQRPIVHAELTKIRDKHGFQNFPVIDQYMFTDPRDIMFTPDPIRSPDDKDANSTYSDVVIKVGTAEAGYGKVKLNTKGTNIKDFAQTVTRYSEFVTVEPYVTHKELDIRVQMIGKDHIRVYERRSSNWKGNQGSSILEEIEVTERYRNWALWASELFGGMTVLTVDAVGVGDEMYILEINDSASGFAKENELEDRKILCKLCVDDMLALLCERA